MAASINGKDFFDDSVFKGWDELLRDMDSAIKKTDELINSAKGLNKALSSGSFKERNKAVKESVKVTTQLSDQDKKLAQIQKQSNLITKDVVKAQVQLAQKRKAARIEAEKELNIQKKSGRLFSTITKSIIAAAAAQATFSAALEFGRKVINSTSTTADKFAKKMQAARNATNVFFKSIATGDLSNLGKRMLEAAEAGQKYAQALIDIRNSQRALNILQAETNKTIESLKIIQDDATRSFEERTAAANKLIKERNDLLSKQEELAEKTYRTELENVDAVTQANKEQILSFIKRFKVSEDLTKQANAYNEAVRVLSINNNKLVSETGQYAGAAIQTNKAIRESRKVVAATSDEVKIYADILKNVGEAAPEELNKISDALVSLLDVQKEQAAFEEESSKVIGELKQDQLERELDFILDVVDARKTAIERQLSDERLSVQERSDLLNKMTNLLNASFSQQIGIISKFTDANLDVNKLINLNNEDSIKYVRTLGLSEIIEGRVLEVIRERIFALQDISDANKDYQLSIDKIDASLKKSTESVISFFDAFNKENIGDFKDEVSSLADELINLSSELSGLEQSIYDDGLKASKDAIDQLKIDEQLKKEERLRTINETQGALQAATNLFVTLQEKELMALQTKLNQGLISEEEFARKSAEIRTKQAKFDKANAVIQSIINTALTVTKLGVITPPAILAGIKGALETATILAQPIPAYKDGTENHIGGRAIVGDGGKHELVKLPDGTLFKTPDSPTLIDNLPKGAIVKPDFDRGMRDIARKNKSVQSPVVIPNTMTMKLKRDDGFEYRKTLRLNKYRGIRG